MGLNSGYLGTVLKMTYSLTQFMPSIRHNSGTIREPKVEDANLEFLEMKFLLN